MARKITQGTVVTQVRWTLEEASEILMAAARQEHPDLEVPDFGDGEGDATLVQMRDKQNNNVLWSLDDTTDLALVLVDEENDPVA
jgi:hypothetical protein